MLFLTEGFTIPGLRRHLGFSYVGPWQHCIPGLQLWTKHVYDTVPKPTCSWWMSHISEAHFQTIHFRPVS